MVKMKTKIAQKVMLYVLKLVYRFHSVRFKTQANGREKGMCFPGRILCYSDSVGEEQVMLKTLSSSVMTV